MPTHEYRSEPKPKPVDSPLLKQTAAEAYGWPEDWRTWLVATQEVCVFGLQLRLIEEAVGGRRSGDVKDLAVALAASVDKLAELHGMPPDVPTASVTPDGAVRFSSTMTPIAMGKIQAAWDSMPS